MSIEKRYVPPSLPLEDLTQELDAFWAELKDPNSNARKIIKDEGIEVDADKLAELRRDQVITVQPGGGGISGVELLVILAPFVPLLKPVVTSTSKVAEKVILDLWDVAFQRWIRPRRKGDALIEKE